MAAEHQRYMPEYIIRGSAQVDAIRASGFEVEHLSEIGLGRLSQEQLNARKDTFLQNLKIGLARQGEPVIGPNGMAIDGGLPAFRTGVKLISPEVWNQVRDNTEVYVASVGGTNFKYKEARKTAGDISFTDINETPFNQDKQKKLTFEQFAEYIAAPIAGAFKQKGHDGRLSLGVSLAHPHTNEYTTDGVDAHLVAEPDGTLEKGWKITNWAELPKEKRSLLGALKERFAAHGIDPDKVDIHILNDTIGTALDITAAQKALDAGYGFPQVAAVGGTGTNFALNYEDELINTEGGRNPLPVDKDGNADPVNVRMRENMKKETGVEQSKLEIEHETGGRFAPENVIAAAQILDIADKDQVVEWLRVAKEERPELTSDLAQGEIREDLQLIARGVHIRAGQVFGLAVAATAEAI
jgi:hypothetical protein